jgi:hypothetical protein
VEERPDRGVILGPGAANRRHGTVALHEQVGLGVE